MDKRNLSQGSMRRTVLQGGLANNNTLQNSIPNGFPSSKGILGNSNINGESSNKQINPILNHSVNSSSMEINKKTNSIFISTPNSSTIPKQNQNQNSSFQPNSNKVPFQNSPNNFQNQPNRSPLDKNIQQLNSPSQQNIIKPTIKANFSQSSNYQNQNNLFQKPSNQPPKILPKRDSPEIPVEFVSEKEIEFLDEVLSSIPQKLNPSKINSPQIPNISPSNLMVNNNLHSSFGNNMNHSITSNQPNLNPSIAINTSSYNSSPNNKSNNFLPNNSNNFSHNAIQNPISTHPPSSLSNPTSAPFNNSLAKPYNSNLNSTTSFQNNDNHMNQTKNGTNGFCMNDLQNNAPKLSNPPQFNNHINNPQMKQNLPNTQQQLFQQIQPTNIPTQPTGGSIIPIPIEFELLSIDQFGIIGTKLFPSELINVLQTIPGSIYDSESKKWLFPTTQYINLCRALTNFPYVQPHYFPKPVIDYLFSSPKPEPDVRLDRIPSALLNSLLPFQREGVIFGIRKDGRCLIADDMGLGKTLQAITIATYYKNEWPLLIICTSSVKLQWLNQVETYLPDCKSSINIANSSESSMDGLINIVSYDIAASSKLAPKLAAKKFNIIIIDESHMLKNNRTKRSKAIIPMCRIAKRVLLLTGTPALSRPKELYTQIQILSPSLFPQFLEYGLRYCSGYLSKFGYNFDGASNQVELHLLLEKTIMIRRLKQNVLTHLPPKKRQKVLINVDQDCIVSLEKIAEDYKKTKQQIVVTNANEQTKLKEVRSDGKRIVLEYFQNSGFAKIPAINEYIYSLYEKDNRKMLIFGHHKGVLDGISHFLKQKNIDFVRIDGSTVSSRRTQFVQYFQTQDSCRIALLSINACSVGLNLTAANIVIFAELFWNPGLLKQAEDRAHRIGQTMPVDVFYLIAQNGIDEWIWNIIEKKLEVLGDVLDGTEEVFDVQNIENFEKKLLDSSIDSFLESLMEQLSSYEERTKERKARQERRKERQTLKQSEISESFTSINNNDSTNSISTITTTSSYLSSPFVKVVNSSPFFSQSSELGKRKKEDPENDFNIRASKSSRKLIVDMEDDFNDEDIFSEKLSSSSSGLSKLDQFQFK